MNRIKFTILAMFSIFFITLSCTTEENENQKTEKRYIQPLNTCIPQEVKIVTDPTYTITNSDCGKLLVFENHTGTIVTVDQTSIFNIGGFVNICNYQQGNLQVVNSGVGLVSRYGNNIVSFGRATIQKKGQFSHILFGEVD